MDRSPAEVQRYLETLWHRVDDDADAACLALLLDLLQAVPDEAAREFALNRGEAVARRAGLPDAATILSG